MKHSLWLNCDCFCVHSAFWILQVLCMLPCSLHPDPVSCCLQSTTAKSASSKVLVAANQMHPLSLASHKLLVACCLLL